MMRQKYEELTLQWLGVDRFYSMFNDQSHALLIEKKTNQLISPYLNPVLVRELEGLKEEIMVTNFKLRTHFSIYRIRVIFDEFEHFLLNTFSSVDEINYLLRVNQILFFIKSIFVSIIKIFLFNFYSSWKLNAIEPNNFDTEVRKHKFPAHELFTIFILPMDKFNDLVKGIFVHLIS